MLDPEKSSEIADAISRLWTDEALSSLLVERGKKRVSRFTWDRTARIFRAHCPRMAKRPLTTEDHVLSREQPLV